MTRALAIAALVVAVLAVAPSGTMAAKSCGSVRVHFGGAERVSRYTVRVTQGHPQCSHARAVLRHFMTTGTPSRGWVCALGHGGDRWAATCATLRKTIVRAYERK